MSAARRKQDPKPRTIPGRIPGRTPGRLCLAPVRRGAGAPIVPFRDAGEAWFWTMAALVARREASPRGCDGAGPPRPALPEDVLRCMDGLYRQRRIDLLHARILRIWGERGIPPDPTRAAERCDARIWREALERLEWPLRVRGIVVAEQH